MTGQFDPRRILFVGTRPLATRCLQYLLKQCPREWFAGVLGLPPGERGWWSGKSYPDLWEVAQDEGLPMVRESELYLLDFDLMICVFWATIFPIAVLEKPRLGCINLHTAPLPNYRGCHAYNHAILNGAEQFGTTLHFMNPKIDCGDIIRVLDFPILPSETAHELYLRTVEYSYALFVETWQRLLDGSSKRISQDEFAFQTGRLPRYYNNSSLEVYLREPECPPTLTETQRLYRGLYNPPKSDAPAWLKQLLRAEQKGG